MACSSASTRSTRSRHRPGSYSTGRDCNSIVVLQQYNKVSLHRQLTVGVSAIMPWHATAHRKISIASRFSTQTVAYPYNRHPDLRNRPNTVASGAQFLLANASRPELWNQKTEPTPWYLKPAVLVGWDLLVLIALIVYDIIELVVGSQGTSSTPATTSKQKHRSTACERVARIVDRGASLVGSRVNNAPGESQIHFHIVRSQYC